MDSDLNVEQISNFVDRPAFSANYGCWAPRTLAAASSFIGYGFGASALQNDVVIEVS
ncbi:hypothetical protein GYH30_013736 [Glycine max]|nr:hypothetical protein GYH30_013736 [Glycine max]